MFNQAYEGRRVFITGHTGFKGSWLSAWLVSLGAEVAGFSNAVPTQPSLFDTIGLEQHMLDIRADVRNFADLNKAIHDFKPHIIFHLAAQALVQTSYEQPVNTFETNTIGTLNVLEAVRNASFVQALVCITSDKCYQNNEWVFGYREDDKLGGHDPYSASKACAEIVAQSYFASYFKDGPACATVRAGNVIGGGDWAKDRIIPDCARAWANGEAVHIRNPWATRPWQHVLEPLSGYLWLGAKLLLQEIKHGESYNFGPAAHINATVAEVVDALKLHWPKFTSIMHEASQDKYECNLLKLCCDKALAHLQWRAVYDFEECIRSTAEWYRAYYSGDKVNLFAFSMGQIAAYTNMAQNRDLMWTKT